MINAFFGKQLVSELFDPTTYVQFDGMVHQQIVGIHMGNNCALLIAD